LIFQNQEFHYFVNILSVVHPVQNYKILSKSMQTIRAELLREHWPLANLSPALPNSLLVCCKKSFDWIRT